MNVTNAEIAACFNEIADLLDIEGANPFRIRAYRNAARSILSHPGSMATLVEEGFDLTELPGIGDDLAGKITEMVRNGSLHFLEELKHEVSPDLEELLHIPGLGPKRVHLLHEKLRVNTADDLRKALGNGSLEALKGFGPKLIGAIAGALKKRVREEPRVRLYEVEPVAEALAAELRRARGVIAVEVAGSIRRRRETVKDIDIVASCETQNDLMQRFVALRNVQKVVMRGPTRSSVILSNGLHVDLRVVPEHAFGAALHHFTGSKAHHIALRKLAGASGFKVNEYGIFKGERRVGGEKEGDVYKLLGMDYIEPELRENRGEIEQARRHALPKLVELGDIRGDLHLHSTYSDGKESIREMALAALSKGYDYIAVTDHTKHLRIAHGLDEKGLLRQMEEIDALNGELQGITILKSAEVDILPDGSLDLDDAVLRRLDLTVCAVHSGMHLGRKAQTLRILRAMEHPSFTILAHPTGRLIGLRDPYDVDIEAIVAACRERGCFLELNAQPDRLDLNDLHCKIAREAGVPVSVATDAHSVGDLELMRCGIAQARRGWLEKGDLLNTLGLEALKKRLKDAR
jgi:DNA polymerase (family 10)